MGSDLCATGSACVEVCCLDFQERGFAELLSISIGSSARTSIAAFVQEARCLNNARSRMGKTLAADCDFK